MNIKPIASSSTGNAYIVSDGKTSLLLECGIPISKIQAACDYKVTSLAGCLISHCHKDHSKAAKDLIKRGVRIYTSAETAEELGLVSHLLCPVKPLGGTSIGTFNVIPFDVEHDAPNPLGYYLKSSETGEALLFFTDTYYVKYKFTGITHIMAECNYDIESIRRNIDNGVINENLAKRIIKSHMSLDHLVDMLKSNDLSKLEQIYLLHMSDNNSNAAIFKNTIQRLTGVEVYIC